MCDHVPSGSRYDENDEPRLVYCRRCLAIKHDEECPCHGTTAQAVAHRVATARTFAAMVRAVASLPD